MYRRNGRLISELAPSANRVAAQRDPTPVRQAFIRDRRQALYDHHGIDYWRFVGAIKNDLLTMSFAQGSRYSCEESCPGEMFGFPKVRGRNPANLSCELSQ